MMKNRFDAVVGVLLVLMPCLPGTLLAADRPVIGWQGRTMGSPYLVKIVGTNLSEAQVATLRREVDQRLATVNRQMSNYLPDSELSRFNRAPAQTPFRVSPEFARVVRFALELSRRSRGAFDPTLGPVIDLWGFGATGSKPGVPAPEALAAARRRTGWQHLSVTPHDELIKDIPDLALDLGGVAKGFGVDQLAALLRTRGFANFYVSIAGEVWVQGHNPRGTKWHLGISAPIDYWRENDPLAAGAWLSQQALSTSGDYQKFFRDAQGRRQSHIIDPRTGRPVQHYLGSVSVVAPNSMTADGLGTTLFVLGREAGLKFIADWTNTAALFIERRADGRFQTTPSPRFDRMTRE